MLSKQWGCGSDFGGWFTNLFNRNHHIAVLMLAVEGDLNLQPVALFCHIHFRSQIPSLWLGELCLPSSPYLLYAKVKSGAMSLSGHEVSRTRSQHTSKHKLCLATGSKEIEDTKPRRGPYTAWLFNSSAN